MVAGNDRNSRDRRCNSARSALLFRYVLLFLMLFFAASAHAQGISYDVEIEADRRIEALLKDNLDLIRWRGNASIDEVQLQRLYRDTPDEIRKLLSTEGYYSPEIESRIEKQGDKTHVRLRVVAGEPVRVRSVELIFQGAIATQVASDRPDKEQLRNGWMMPPGTIFSQREWEAAKAALLRQVIQVRYPRAHFTETQATVDPDTRQVSLLVAIDSGEPVRFGAIRIEGLERYPESVVLRENRIKTGDVYRESALRAWQSRLQDSGYFRNVEVAADVESGAAEVPVRITVAEYQRKRIGLGAGYSTNTGNRMQLAYDDLNFLGQDLKLNSQLSLENLRQAMSANVLLPSTQQGYRDSAGVLYERTAIEGVVSRIASTNAKRAWGTPNLERSVTLEYINEKRTVAGFGTNYNQALPLTYAVTWRRLDSRLTPTRGYALQAQVGAALEPVLTDTSFVRTYLKGIRYQPVGSNGELIVRGEMGAVVSNGTDGIPTPVLFRAGGDQSVRGYAYQSLGVHQGSAIVGGRYLAIASAEYQYWFLPKWGAAIFVDAGNAADSLNNLDPAVGYGVGARWKSPVGPISVDIAYGRRAEEFRLHFSLGFTF